MDNCHKSVVWDTCSAPTVPPGGVWSYVRKRTGKWTVRPERVVRGLLSTGGVGEVEEWGKTSGSGNDSWNVGGEVVCESEGGLTSTESSLMKYAVLTLSAETVEFLSRTAIVNVLSLREITG